MSVYKIIELVGTSEKSWEDAAKQAIQTAGKKLKDLRVAEVKKLDIETDESGTFKYRCRLDVSFKYHTE